MRSVPLLKENQVVIPKCWVAESFFSRFLGLMGKQDLPTGEAIFFPSCSSIHTLFMRFTIDVLLLSKDGEIRKIVASVPPWRLLRPRFRISHVIELTGGAAAKLGLKEGDALTLEGILN